MTATRESAEVAAARADAAEARIHTMAAHMVRVAIQNEDRRRENHRLRMQCDATLDTANRMLGQRDAARAEADGLRIELHELRASRRPPAAPEAATGEHTPPWRTTPRNLAVTITIGAAALIGALEAITVAAEVAARLIAGGM